MHKRELQRYIENCIAHKRTLNQQCMERARAQPKIQAKRLIHRFFFYSLFYLNWCASDRCGIWLHTGTHTHIHFPLYMHAYYIFENKIELQYVQVKFSRAVALFARRKLSHCVYAHTSDFKHWIRYACVSKYSNFRVASCMCIVYKLQANQYCYFANSKYIKLKLDERAKKDTPFFSLSLSECACLSVGPTYVCLRACFFSLLVRSLFQLSHRKTQIRPSIGKYT